MNKRTKLILVVIIFILIVLGIVIINKNKDMRSENLVKNIQIIVYDDNKEKLYDEKKQTEKIILIDLLKSLDDLKIETEAGDYGEYIVLINNKKQGNNYYWNYYINGEYAPVGVSNYKIKDNDIYTFKLEKFN